MKVKLTYLLFLLILVLSVTPSTASIENINIRSIDLEYSYPYLPINYSNTGSGKSIEHKQFLNQANSNKSTGKEESPQISQIQQAAMNASVIQVSETFASLIAVLFRYGNESYPLTFPPAHQATLFNVLFQVIISTNAP